MVKLKATEKIQKYKYIYREKDRQAQSDIWIKSTENYDMQKIIFSTENCVKTMLHMLHAT